LRPVCHKLSYQRCGNCFGSLGSIWSERQGRDLKASRRKKENPMKVFTAVLASALFIAPAAMFAQTPTPGAHDYNINQRKVDQQDRIGNGVKSGQLTAGETARLEHQEAGVNKEERGMRAQDNGHLTSQDRKTIHAQQNQESRRIYRDKHNAAVR
jgi:methionine-rich copper-binding protein CopC